MNMIMGWWVPNGDTYFGKFLTTPGKSNGFQVDHLYAAFEHVVKWDVAIDVGAHCGFWTVPMAEKFKAVHAFEMAPDTFACLQRNTAEIDNIRVYNSAVGHQSGRCRVSEDPTRQGNTGSRFVGKGDETRMVRIDDYDWPSVDLLKVDVEGFEARVLEGAWKTIQRFRPVIIMETDKAFARVRYFTPDDEAEQMLLSLGYTVAAHMRPDKVFVP